MTVYPRELYKVTYRAQGELFAVDSFEMYVNTGETETAKKNAREIGLKNGWEIIALEVKDCYTGLYRAVKI